MTKVGIDFHNLSTYGSPPSASSKAPAATGPRKRGSWSGSAARLTACWPPAGPPASTMLLGKREERQSAGVPQASGGSLYLCEFADNFNAHVLKGYHASRGWVLQECKTVTKTRK